MGFQIVLLYSILWTSRTTAILCVGQFFPTLQSEYLFLNTLCWLIYCPLVRYLFIFDSIGAGQAFYRNMWYIKSLKWLRLRYYTIHSDFRFNPAINIQSYEVFYFSIQPGVGSVQSPDDLTIEKRNVTTADTLMDLVRNLFPENIIQVCDTLQQLKVIHTWVASKIDSFKIIFFEPK